MLSPINKIREISYHFDHHEMVENYRIQLNGDLGLNVYVLVKEKEKVDYTKWSNGNGLIKIEEMSNEELQENDYVKFLFEESEEKVNFGYRQRLRSLLEPIEPFDNQEFPPIVSFYSYKGGMGRTTTLAGFAMHCAYHLGWKVLVIDCDLEAPGMTNFYDISDDKLADTNGIVEYLLNKEFEQPENIDISDYIITVDKSYTGQGDIFIMPAGNLSDTFENENYAVDKLEFAEGNTLSKYDIHRTHYFEGLARINLYNPEKVIKDFSDLIQTLKKRDYSPDLILIDSRTGFNEILGTIAIKLSDIIVGFFREELQAKPGLHYLLDKIFGKKLEDNELEDNKDLVLVHAINDSSDRLDNFEETIEDIAVKYDEGAGLPQYDVFNLYTNKILADIGSRNASKNDYERLIKEEHFISYNNIFNHLKKQIERIQQKKNPIEHISSQPSGSGDTLPFLNQKNTKDNQIIVLKKLKPYCERIFGVEFDFEGKDKNFLEHQFYYRDVMLNVFNSDKFLILASKGTGKTLFHKALVSDTGLRKLKKLAGRSERYESLNIIKKSNPQLFFPVEKFATTSIPENKERFYGRFWIIYLWTAIALQYDELTPSDELKSLAQPIGEKESESEQRFLSTINNEDVFKKIEDDLKNWDKYLIKNNVYLIASYDLLDEVVPARFRQEGTILAPLIKYWRYNPFKRILPKIFLRTELFRITGITNSGELERAHSINLEWKKEEIFALLFKQILTNTKSEFLSLMYVHSSASTQFIEEVYAISESKENQIPLEKKYLNPMVEVFLGEHVGGQGYAYDWFYKNLRNANDTISVRPFLNLMDIAIEDALIHRPQYLGQPPVLHHANYANPNARSKAVEDYYRDLAGEGSNQPLNHILDAFHNAIPPDLKKDKLTIVEFKALLKLVFDYKNVPINVENIKYYERQLIDNGIVKIVYGRKGKKMYSFAYLYKFFFGLKSPKNKYQKNKSTRRRR